MAYSVESRPNNPAAHMRDLLDKAERLVVQVDGSNIAELLTLLDTLEATLAAFEGEGIDLRAEHTRWDSLLARLDSNPDNLLRAAAVVGGLPKLRAQRQSPPAGEESFWWRLDEIVAQRRRANLRRVLTTVVGLVAVIALLLWSVETFFPPDPDAVLMVETTSRIDQLIMAENWAEALALVQTTRQQLPQQPELILWEVVFQERLGDSAAAATALQEAQTVLADRPADLWITLGNNRLRVGDIAGAVLAADQALAIAPTEPQVTFLLGGIAEAQGNIPAAIDYFDQTFTLAQATNPQLAVIARVRMGNLLQSPAAFESPVATPTP